MILLLLRNATQRVESVFRFYATATSYKSHHDGALKMQDWILADKWGLENARLENAQFSSPAFSVALMGPITMLRH